MNEAAQLLQTGLSVLLVPILLTSRALRKKFATDPSKPTLHEAWIYLSMALMSGGLSYAQHSVAPAPVASLTDLWWVQGLLFFAALILADLGVDATSIKTPSALADIRAGAPKEVA